MQTWSALDTLKADPKPSAPRGLPSSEMKRPPSQPFATLILGILCAILGWWFWHNVPPKRSVLTRASFDSYFSLLQTHSHLPADSPIVIVYLDLQSHLDLKRSPTQPWPRELHAELLNRLTRAQAKAVVFDIVFDSKGPSPEADQAFQEALQNHPSVVLAGEIKVFSMKTSQGHFGRALQSLPPYEPFQKAAHWGLGELAVDEDFVCRTLYRGNFSESPAQPSLAEAVSQVLQIPNHLPSPESESPAYVRYYGPPYTLPHVNFTQALQPNEVPDSFFKDKIVFIGARPMAGVFGERRDEFRNPYQTWGEKDLFIPGVEVHAFQLLNIIQNDWLRRLPLSQEQLILLGFGLLLPSLLVPLRPGLSTSLAVALSIAVILTASYLFEFRHFWFPWLIPLLIQIPTALSGSILFHGMRWYTARRRLEAEKKIAQEQIKEQAALISKAHDAIFVHSFSGQITYCNPSAERLYEVTFQDLVNSPSHSPFDPATFLHARDQALEFGEWNGELHQTLANGKTLIVDSRWTLIRNDFQQPKALLTIVSDITERKQLEAETLRMQRMEALGALAGGMAHDLNNALAPVLMGTQLLQAEIPSENSRRILSLMETSTRRGADMVRQVLLFARGRQEDLEPIDITPLLKEILKLAQDTFPKNIHLIHDLCPQPWNILGSPTQIHQAFLNLFVNARDAMDHGGTLTLSTENLTLSPDQLPNTPEAAPGDYLLVMVADTGCGMSPETATKALEPFFTTKPEGKGTGLGLSTTHRIIRNHHGFIYLSSEINQGTTFEIYLPRYHSAPTAPSTTTYSIELRGNRRWILVAEDNQAVNELLKRGLEDLGFQVISAKNGVEALSAFKSHPEPISLLITGTSLPMLDGFNAAQQILKAHPNLPILFISGEDSAENVKEFPRGNKIAFLLKPFQWNDIKEKIHSLLHQIP